jgi:uncharacterized protein YfaA (DUF2138 family)
MKLKIIIFIISVVFLLGCSGDKIVISGEIKNCNNSYLPLIQIYPDEVVVIDTVLLLNGKFSHRIKSKEVGVYLLKFSDDVFLSFIADAGDKLIFSGNDSNLLNNYDIQGNKETKLLMETQRKLEEVYRNTKPLSKDFVRYTENNHLDSIQIIDSLYNVLFETHKTYLTNIIRSNPDKLASLMAFYQKLGVNTFFSVEKDRELLEMIYFALLKKYPNSIYVEDLKEKLEEKF